MNDTDGQVRAIRPGTGRRVDMREDPGTEWRHRVSDALTAGRVALARQPVVQARAPEKLAFCEGLIRLRDRTGRALSPGAFIAAIDGSATGAALDRTALGLALDALARDPSLRLSVNLSPANIVDTGWARCLAAAIDRDPTLAERLIVEITEQAVPAAPEAVAAFVNRWQASGVAFALDDFGAGATAFRHLRDIRFDIIKIDRRFGRDIDRDPDNRALVKAMAGLARHFESLLVVEGVESAAAAACLIDLGADALQGFHFGHPTVMASTDAQVA